MRRRGSRLGLRFDEQEAGNRKQDVGAKFADLLRKWCKSAGKVKHRSDEFCTEILVLQIRDFVA